MRLLPTFSRFSCVVTKADFDVFLKVFLYVASSGPIKKKNPKYLFAFSGYSIFVVICIKNIMFGREEHD